MRLCPTYDEKYTNQTDYSPCSEEEFDKGVKVVGCSTSDRIIQFIFFFLFLAPIRIVILLLGTIVFLIFVFVPMCTAKIEWLRPYFYTYSVTCARIYIRFFLFLIGIYKINIKGEMSKDVRCYMFNHQSITDGPLIWIYRPFTVIVMAEILKVPLVGRALIAVESLFVDRTKSAGMSKIITDHMENKNMRVLALSPEGKTTKGFFMLKFRTGSFIANVPIQPVCIRYKMYGSYGQTGIEWIVGGFGEWILRMMASPFIVAELDFLPVMNSQEFYSKTPVEKAKEVNLLMANRLGLKLVDKTTKDFFNNEKYKDD